MRWVQDSLQVTTGDNSVGIGFGALQNTTGNNNLALGFQSGINITGGSNNIHLSNTAAGGDNAIIRIGVPGVQTKNFQAAIRGVTTDNANGLPVLVDSAGQLGTISSTRDSKENINYIDSTSNYDRIMSFIPRKFNFKGKDKISYGMIVDEVEDIFPDMIARDSLGKPMSLYYDYLPIMLLKHAQDTTKTLNSLIAKLKLLNIQL